MSLLSDRLNTLNAWNSSTQGEARQPAQNMVQQPATQQPSGQTIYDMVKEYGKPYDYEQEMRQAERSRKMGMLTDFIKSATDFGSALAGRRMFDNGVSATKQASDRMDKIRDIQRHGTINYQNALLNARLKDAEIARNEAQRKAQMDLQRQSMANDQYWKQRAYDQSNYQFERNQELSRQKLKQDQDQFEQRNALTLSENAKDRASREAIANVNASRGSSSGNKTIEFYGKDGRRTVLPNSAAMGVAPFLYGKMQQIIASDPNDKRTLEDWHISMGEGGDVASKMLAIVQRRLQDFPELQNELNAIYALNTMYPNATPDEWDKILRGEDPSIKTWSPDMEQQPKQEEKKEQEYILFDPNK